MHTQPVTWSRISDMFTSLYLCVKSSGSRLSACCVYARAHNDERVQAELYRANQIQPTPRQRLGQVLQVLTIANERTLLKRIRSKVYAVYNRELYTYNNGRILSGVFSLFRCGGNIFCEM